MPPFTAILWIAIKERAIFTTDIMASFCYLDLDLAAFIAQNK